jgi:hypothetical protein
MPRGYRRPCIPSAEHGALTIPEAARLTGRRETTIRRRVDAGFDPLFSGDYRRGNKGGVAGRRAGFTPCTCEGGGIMFTAARLVRTFGQRTPTVAQLAQVLPGMHRANLYRWRRALHGNHDANPVQFGMEGCVEIARRWSHPVPALADWPLLVADVDCSRATAYRLIRAMRDAAGLP